MGKVLGMEGIVQTLQEIFSSPEGARLRVNFGLAAMAASIATKNTTGTVLAAAGTFWSIKRLREMEG